MIIIDARCISRMVMPEYKYVPLASTALGSLLAGIKIKTEEKIIGYRKEEKEWRSK